MPTAPKAAVVRSALMSGNTGWRILLSVVAIGLAVFFVVDRPAQLGLDLKGGTQVVLDLQPRPGQTVNSDLANRTLEVLRRRVDSLGVSEPNLEVAGEKRIIVELPGVTDSQAAVNVIGSTAQLTFHRVNAEGTSNTSSAPNQAPASQAPTPSAPAPSSPPTTAAGLGASSSTSSNGATVLGQAQQPTATTSAPALPTPAAGSSTATNASGSQDQLGAITVPDDTGTLLQLEPAALTGDGVADATAQPPDQSSSSWYIDLKFKGDGAKKWTQLTGQAACAPSGDPKRQVAIVLDNKVISHPEVQASGSSPVQCNVGITGDTTQITGQFTQKQAQNLALLIRGGALPVDVKIASQQVIGPELGKTAIHAARNAVVVGGILTILYILVYYRLLGLMAAVALGAYGVISYATLIGLKLTLTLPGIAGFVLAVGMAMDSNILVFERTKEEFANGRSLRASSQMGFKNALSAIIDSNATTFIAALTLFFLAVGEVKGFGVTLLVGVIASIFTTLVVVRTLVQGLLSMDWARRRPGALGMYVGARFRRRMSENPPNVIGASRYFLTVSAIVIIVALGGLVVRGVNYGIEFTGGRQLVYTTAHTVNLDTARSEMGKLGFPRAVVQRSGTDGTSVRVPTLTKEQADKVDEVMKNLGGGKADRVNDETIGPSFGKELKRKAAIGLVVGIALQLIYVAIRFRWTFGIGAVVAMVHDGLLLVGLFAWLQKPFDAVFLASLLTIIAYSVNDTVVVFDRIREQRRRRAGEEFSRVVSDACAQTFPRTVNIALSAIFILATLLFFGGQTLADFALALLVGIVTGVYSSVMVASPIATVLEKWKPGVTARPTAAAARRAGAQRRPVRSDDSAGGEDDEAFGGSGRSSGPSGGRTANRPAPRPRKKSSKRRR